MSSAVGRSVDIGSVQVRMLPRPGFDLENLVVYDDPAFGAEPILRAGEVTASLRLLSLLRGRIEISRLDLTEPSLNLVHEVNGRWNLEALLERSAKIPLAPTSKTKSEARQGFPYIEATSARINFKNGAEKKPYALTNADFSLWQDSENSWGVRLRAQPFRTDLNLNDTGNLQVSGTWQRASSLHDTPLQISVEWNRAQLGQLTKFFTGNDQGWRGAVQFAATLTGTPANLQIASDTSIQDFRRYDIATGDALRLAAHCDAQYRSSEHSFHEVLCNAPVGDGSITLKGNMGLPGSHNYELVLSAMNVPASAAVALAQRAKKNLPSDLATEGTLQGNVTIAASPNAPRLRFEGQGEFSEFHLTSASNTAEIGPQTIPFLVKSGDGIAKVSKKTVISKGTPPLRDPDESYVELGPFSLANGRAAAPTLRGWVAHSGYNVTIAGNADIAKMLRWARIAGLPALQANVEGPAEVDLQIAGDWAGWGYGTNSGFAAPHVTGSARLHNERLVIRGTGAPIEISSADMQLAAEQVHIRKLNAKLAGATWSGSLEMPRACGTPGACEVHFNLNANQIVFADLSEWVNAKSKDRPWYQVLESGAQGPPSFLASVRAAGHLTADRAQTTTFSATRVSANIDLSAGKLDISDLNAEFLGGKHRGTWRADFTTKPAICKGSGNISGILLERLADTTKDNWIAGSADASYDLKGECPANFWRSADGTLRFDGQESTLEHISLKDDSGPLRITRWTGQVRVHGGNFEIKDAQLNSTRGQLVLSGTASLEQKLDLTLAKPANGTPAATYTISGTLAEPVVVPNPQTQAELKPDASK